MEETKNNESKSLIQVLNESFKELGDTFSAFFKAPRALWGINIPYIIEGLVYFGILTILGKYCSENVALTDPQAGWVYSFLTGGITFAMLVLGGVSDKIGIRRSLAFAFLIMAAGRSMVSLSGSVSLGQGIGSPMFFMMVSGLFLMVIGYGLYQPAAYAGVKRYTNPKTSAMGYAVIYGLMNFGAFFSGFISPLTRHSFETIFPPNGLGAVFWLYTGLTLIAMLSTIFIITKKTDKKAVEQIAKETSAHKNDNPDGNEESGEQEEVKEKVNNFSLFVYSSLALFFLALGIFIKTGYFDFPFTAVVGLFSVSIFIAGWEFFRKRPEHPFRDARFVLFIFILIPVQTLFAHNWLTLPYYLDRAFYGSVVSEYFELFSNINPLLIFILAPVVAGLTAKANVYKMMIYGTFVMALPTFLLAFGPNMYLFLTYILIMSVGEAMWQPRFLQWIAEIAPKGKTGAYMGIGQLPWFLTKVLTGLYSGYFIANYVPRPKGFISIEKLINMKEMACYIPEPAMPMQTGQMWFIYGLIAIVTPIALVLVKNRLSKGMTRNGD